MIKFMALLQLVLFSFSVKAQWQKPNNAYGTIQNRVNIDSVLLIPTGCGEPKINIIDSSRQKYAVYGDSCNNKVYFYNPKTATWSVNPGTGISGIPLEYPLRKRHDTLYINLDSIPLQYGLVLKPDSIEDNMIPAWGWIKDKLDNSYRLPFNGNATYYLGGDTVYHVLPAETDPTAIHLTGNQLGINGDKLFNNSFKTSTSTNVSWGNNANYGILSWDAGKAIINTTSGNSLVLRTAGNEGISIDLNGNATVRGNIKPSAANTASSSPIMSQIYPSNKKWCIFGDSFSASLVSGYPANVISRILFTGTVTNAVSGNKISNQSAKLDSILIATPNYFDAFNIVSILVGVNDFAGNSTLGNYTDTAGQASYVGVLKHMIESILTKKPTIELYVMTPPEGNGAGVSYKGINSAGWTLEQLSETIKKVCNQYAIQVIDLYNLSGFNQISIPSLTTDGLHPNTIGSSIIGNIIANVMK